MTEPNQRSNDRTRKEWTTGSYSTLARIFLPLAAELVDAVGVEAGDRVLDVRKSLRDFRSPSEISDF